MTQPDWKLLSAWDDGAIYVDATGAYAPEIETFEIASEDEDDDDATGEIYRFSLERCRVITELNGEECIPYLTTGPADGAHPHDHKEWFSDDLGKVASSVGCSVAELREAFISADIMARARAYQDVCGYHGVANFDQYPTPMTRAEWSARKRTGAEHAESAA